MKKTIAMILLAVMLAADGGEGGQTGGQDQADDVIYAEHRRNRALGVTECQKGFDKFHTMIPLFSRVL